MSDKKETLTGLFRDQPGCEGGKYLVLRRDNTVPDWEWFVLGARDPIAAWALWVYSWVGWLMGYSPGWCKSVNQMSWRWCEYRKVAGVGDPDKGRHRKDDPTVIVRMKEGRGA